LPHGDKEMQHPKSNSITLYDGGIIFLTALWIAGGFLGMAMLIPFFAIWTWHKRKVEEIRMRKGVLIAEETRKAIEGLRAEMASLRDTTTQYDVGFDTALHRLESRMANVEQRVTQVERSPDNVMNVRA
jgi:hypothetical protein